MKRSELSWPQMSIEALWPWDALGLHYLLQPVLRKKKLLFSCGKVVLLRNMFPGFLSSLCPMP